MDAAEKDGSSLYILDLLKFKSFALDSVRAGCEGNYFFYLGGVSRELMGRVIKSSLGI
jgi:hypothetical protein